MLVDEEFDVIDEPENPATELGPQVVRPGFGNRRPGCRRNDPAKDGDSVHAGSGSRKRIDLVPGIGGVAADAVRRIRAGHQAAILEPEGRLTVHLTTKGTRRAGQQQSGHGHAESFHGERLAPVSRNARSGMQRSRLRYLLISVN